MDSDYSSVLHMCLLDLGLYPARAKGDRAGSSADLATNNKTYIHAQSIFSLAGLTERRNRKGRFSPKGGASFRGWFRVKDERTYDETIDGTMDFSQILILYSTRTKGLFLAEKCLEQEEKLANKRSEEWHEKRHRRSKGG